MDSRIWLRASAGAVVSATIAFSAYAQDGPYDPAFGDVGRTWIDVSTSTTDAATKLIRLPNGNFFMAGTCEFSPCAAWLTEHGALATGYGKSGTGTAWFKVDYPGWPTGDANVNDAAAFPDGRVAIAVQGGYLTVLRADGSGLDTAVGNGAGYVIPALAPDLVRVTPGQKVIAVTAKPTANPPVIAVARYDSTLHLDTTFGSGGSTTIGFGSSPAFVRGMTLQRDGKIVVIGKTEGNPPNSVAIIRLTAEGAPDTEFGVNSDGKFKSMFGNTPYGAIGRDVVEDEKGRLVITGLAFTADGLGTSWLVNRILGGGAIDTGFNGGQPQIFIPIFPSKSSSSPISCCVGLQSDGRIVVAGQVPRESGTGDYFAMARFFDNGAFDPTWGGGGQSYGDMSTQAPNVLWDVVYSMVVMPGGIVIGGNTKDASGEKRFTATGLRTDLLLAADFE